MKKVSIMLIDWSVRESFHAVDYLNKQTIPRSDYEIIWIEYYNRRPKAIEDFAAQGKIDKWLVLNKTGAYFKHLMLNEGVVASDGEIVVLCDSDAIFSSTFIESIITTFDHNKNIVLNLDQVRINNKDYYPFKYIPWEELKKKADFQMKPPGLTMLYDLIHCRNYGACFCATRDSIIEMGGLDEHPSYHCFFSGGELGWRMVNKGYREIWHQGEWVFHVWHPRGKSDVDTMGQSDGKGVNYAALEVTKTKRITPLVENENIRYLRTGNKSDKGQRQNLFIVSDKPIEIRPKKFQDYLREFKLLIKYLLTPVLIKRILLVEEFDCESSLERNIKYTGIVGRIHEFDYDIRYYKLGRQGMFEQLINTCKKFNLDLIIFVPLKNTAGLSSSQTVEPTKNLFKDIADNLGIKLYVHSFNFKKSYAEWLDVANYVGLKNFKSDKYVDNHKVIYGYPAVNPIDFYDQNIERDIDVCFWGSIPIGSKREKYIDFLRDNGINVYVRLYRVPIKKYAEILNRSKISLVLGNEGKGGCQIQAKAFEIMACNSLLLDEAASDTKRLFDANKDFIVFGSKEELLEKIRYYLLHEEERRLIAQSGYDKVMNVYNARNMWENVFKNMGFGPKNAGIYLKITYFCFEFLQGIIKGVAKKILPLEFRMQIRSIISKGREK